MESILKNQKMSFNYFLRLEQITNQHKYKHIYSLDTSLFRIKIKFCNKIHIDYI